MIMKALDAAVEAVKQRGYVPVYAALYGSQNYGLSIHTDDYQSDYDVKVVVMPELFDLVFGRPTVSETIVYEFGQVDIKDVVSMADIICRMNPSYLEILETPYYLIFPGGEFMESFRHRLINLLEDRAQIFVHACGGMFSEKRQKMKRPTPKTMERIATYGYEGKEAHHMLRIKLLLEEFHRTGRLILYPPSHEHENLMRLKKNEMSCAEVDNLCELWAQQVNAVIRKYDEAEVKNDTADDFMHEARHALYESLLSEAAGNTKAKKK